MRKALLFIAASFLCLQVSAQDKMQVKTGKTPAPVSNRQHKNVAGSLRNSFHAVHPSPAAVIFSEDFSGGAIPATWTNTDNAPPGGVWTWSNTGPANGDPALDSNYTSSENGFVIFDSDGYGNDMAPENADLITPSINCSASSSVFLSFNSRFTQYLVSTGTVQVSNDSGATWNTVYTVDSTSVVNPEYIVINISAFAANQANVKVKFNYIGDWDYYWMLDDISVYEPVATDAGVSAGISPASGCSLTAAEPVTVTIRNYGGTSISNVPVTYILNSNAPVTEVVTATIPANGTYDYTFTATADLSTIGIYNLTVYTSLAGDSVSSNDTLAGTVENIMADNLSTPYVMDFEPTDDLTGWAVLDNDGDPVTWAVVNTFAYTGTNCLRKAGSAVFDDDYVWTRCFDLVAGTNYTLNYWYRQFDNIAPCSLEVKLATAQTIAATNQLIATEVNDSIYHNSINTFSVASSGVYYVAFHAFLPNTAPTMGSSSLRIDDITLSVATALNETENKGGVKIYPNPSSGLMTLNVKNYNNARVRVFNVIGKELMNESINSAYRALDLSGYAAGLYVVKVEGDGFVYSQKVTISK